MLTKLRSAIAHLDEECDATAEQYMNGKVDHDTFCKVYRDMRRLYHTRAAKLEKMTVVNVQK